MAKNVHTAADGEKLDRLLAELSEAKAEEQRAKDRRLEAEDAVLGYGTIRHNLRPGTVHWLGDELQLTIEQEVERKVDEPKFRAAIPPEYAQMLLRPKWEFSQQGFSALVKTLEANAAIDAASKALLARLTRAVEAHVTVRECKPSLRVGPRA